MSQQPGLADELAVVMNLPELSSRRQPQNTAEQGGAEQGAAEQVETQQVEAKPGAAEQGATEQGEARQGVTEQGEARQGEAQQGEADGAITKFTDLAEFFPDNSVEDLYSLELVTAGDGQSVTVGQLKDLYQNRQAFEQEKTEFETQRSRQQEEIEQARQALASQFQSPGEIPEELWKARGELEAVSMYMGSVDWGKLEEDDPGKAALLMQRYQTAKQNAAEKLEKLQTEHVEKQQKSRNDYLAAQRQETLKRIPDWENSETLRSDQQKLDALAGSYGFDPQFVSSISDARLLHLMRDYAVLKEKLDSMETNSKQVQKRGNPVLRPTFRSTEKSRIKNVENRAKQPNATKADKHAAMLEVFKESGII